MYRKWASTHKYLLQEKQLYGAAKIREREHSLDFVLQRCPMNTCSTLNVDAAHALLREGMIIPSICRPYIDLLLVTVVELYLEVQVGTGFRDR